MKRIPVLILLLFISAQVHAQRAENLVIITLDGLRWQELFRGMDSAIANKVEFHRDDSNYIFQEYWHVDPMERRKKLFPFIWSTVASQGTIAGNRDLGNKVNCANPHWFSFPGYSEIFTGYPDSSINRNDHPANPFENVLEFFNRRPDLKGKVVAFGAWDAFDRILNERRSGIPVINAFDTTGGTNPTASERLINKMLLNSHRPWLEAECLDVFTHYSAVEWLTARKPKVLYIAYGETDEWAHSGMYRPYLDAARQADKWIGEIWTWLQSNPQYRNNTTLFITTDHGRGDLVKKDWTRHNNQVIGAGEIWYAAIGPRIRNTGEQRQETQVFQAQFAATFARLMGLVFKTDHPVEPPLQGLFK